MGHLFVLLTCLQQLFHLYLGRLANFVSYTFKILVTRWRTTDSYKLRIMSWPLISPWCLDFDICFLMYFVFPGWGTWTKFDDFSTPDPWAFYKNFGSQTQIPTLARTPPPPPGLYIDRCIICTVNWTRIKEHAVFGSGWFCSYTSGTFFPLSVHTGMWNKLSYYCLKWILYWKYIIHHIYLSLITIVCANLPNENKFTYLYNVIVRPIAVVQQTLRSTGFDVANILEHAFAGFPHNFDSRWNAVTVPNVWVCFFKSGSRFKC